MSGFELMIYLGDREIDKASRYLRKLLAINESKQMKFALIPLMEEDVWFLVKVDVINKKICIADTRNDIIKHNCSMIGPLVIALEKVIKAKWIVDHDRLAGIPKCRNLADSGVLMCLNLACLAIFNNKR